MKWYEEKYISRRDWILDHLEMLGLDGNELMIVMVIDFLNEHRQPTSMEVLYRKTGMSEDETNRTVSTLCAKHYLEICASASSVRFDLSGLFETDTARQAGLLDNSLFSTFENEFGRTLSNQEMQKISDWNKEYDKLLILYALREASIYDKKSIGYIDRILHAWHSRNITARDIEEGKKPWTE